MLNHQKNQKLQKSWCSNNFKIFGVGLAEEILAEYGHPDLIVVNNVYAHIPDQQDFTKGMTLLSNDSTIITIENPSFDVLLNNAFLTLFIMNIIHI